MQRDKGDSKSCERMVGSTSSEPSAAYRHQQYVESFAEHGEPLHLPRSNGWLLVRSIPRTAYRDAMGNYPLFCCDNWPKLSRDLSEIEQDLVSVVLVTDPFGCYTKSELAQCFDGVRHFKDHYIVDLTRPLEENISKSNRATARRALRKLQVRILPEPAECLDEWSRLFDNMISRQNLTGVRRYSLATFLRQLRTPGAVMFEARSNDEVVGLDMIYVDGNTAYGHVCAFNEAGYRLRASYATRWRMLEYLQGRVKYFDFGGSVGTADASETDSLAAYKRRWCAMTKPVFLCTSILNRAVYDELSRRLGKSGNSGYFPAYRQGEYQ